MISLIRRQIMYIKCFDDRNTDLLQQFFADIPMNLDHLDSGSFDLPYLIERRFYRYGYGCNLRIQYLYKRRCFFYCDIPLAFRKEHHHSHKIRPGFIYIINFLFFCDSTDFYQTHSFSILSFICMTSLSWW